MYQPQDPVVVKAPVKSKCKVKIGVRATPKISPRPEAVVNDNVEAPQIIFDRTRNIEYQQGRFLGEDRLSRCYEVVDPKAEHKQTLACRIINKKIFQNPHQREQMNQEIAIHRDLKHDYILNFHSSFEDENNVYILLEIWATQTLKELLKSRHSIPEPDALDLFRQLALAVFYLHEVKGIIHRDLKLENIFINDDMEIKIGGFGLATHISFDGERRMAVAPSNPPDYAAPEISLQSGHSFEVDIWSMGSILHTLLFGESPFETNIEWKIRREHFYIPSSRFRNCTLNLIKQMLQIHPSLRPTVSQILDLEFLAQNAILFSLPAWGRPTTDPGFDRDSRPTASGSSSRRPPIEPRGST